MTRGKTWAVVPVKPFHSAKVRLAAILDAAERAHLARVMLEDVLDAVARTGDLLAGCIVLTADEDAAALARQFDVLVLEEPAPAGGASVRRSEHEHARDPRRSPSPVSRGDRSGGRSARRSPLGCPVARVRRWRHEPSGLPARGCHPAKLRAVQFRTAFTRGASRGHRASRAHVPGAWPGHRSAGRSGRVSGAGHRDANAPVSDEARDRRAPRSTACSWRSVRL